MLTLRISGGKELLSSKDAKISAGLTFECISEKNL